MWAETQRMGYHARVFPAKFHTNTADIYNKDGVPFYKDRVFFLKYVTPPGEQFQEWLLPGQSD